MRYKYVLFLGNCCWKGMLVAFFLWVQASEVNAQNQRMNLIQLLEQGKSIYPSLRAKEAEVQSSERKVMGARMEYIPGVVLGHQYTYSTSNNVEGAFFPNEGTALSPSGGIRADNIYQGAFGSFTSSMIDWRLVNFGKIAANVNVAKAENRKSEADYQNELFQYQIKLADAYLLTLIGSYLTKVQRRNFQRAEISKTTVQAQVAAGLRPGVDSALATAEYVKAKLLLLESEKKQKEFEYRLYEMLGGVQDTLTIDSMFFFIRLPISGTVQPSSITQAPLLRLYQTNVELSKARSIAINRSFYPSISLIGAAWARGAGISNKDHSYRTDFASGVEYQVYNYLLGAAVRWNITNYPRIRNDFKSEQFQMQRFQFQYQAQLLRQHRELSESEMQFSVSLQQAQLAPVQLEAARQAYTQAQARYESGLTDLPTYYQSLVTLNRAEADVFIAYSNAWRALLMKAASAGELSVFLNQVQ